MYLKIKDELLQLPKRTIANMFNPDDYEIVVYIQRIYGNAFLNNYANAVNRGDFAKNASKAVPLCSYMFVYETNQGDTQVLRKGETVYDMNMLDGFAVLENANCMIPKGCYEIRFADSPKFGMPMPYICDVPRRSGIMFHKGNYAKDSLGCLLVGKVEDCEQSKLCNSTECFERFYELLSYHGAGKVLLIIDDKIDIELPF